MSTKPTTEISTAAGSTCDSKGPGGIVQQTKGLLRLGCDEDL